MKFLRLIALVAWLATAGCGTDRPPLASLTGTVTLDGKPIANGGLMFSPVDGGRPSVAGTNENGEYEAIYVYGTAGAIIGTHKVSFEEGVADNGPEDEFKPYAPPTKNYVITPKEIEVESAGTVIHFKLEKKKKK